jgi:hypothetical protein
LLGATSAAAVSERVIRMSRSALKCHGGTPGRSWLETIGCFISRRLRAARAMMADT